MPKAPTQSKSAAQPQPIQVTNLNEIKDIPPKPKPTTTTTTTTISAPDAPSELLGEGSAAGQPSPPFAPTNQPTTPNRKREIGTTLAVTYGQVQISFTLRELCEPQSILELDALYDKQVGALMHEHDRFVEFTLPKLKLQGINIGYVQAKPQPKPEQKRTDPA